MPEVYSNPYGNLVAACHVTILEGSAVFTGNTTVYGFASVALNGTVVELTFAPDGRIAPAQALILAQTEGTVGTIAHVAQASNDLVSVRVLDDASAPADTPFNIAVFRKGMP